MSYVEGKAVVVTGAGQGLGRAYALDLGSHGASVVVNDVDAARADEVAAEVEAAGGRAVPSHDSVASWAGAEAIVALCRSAFGSVDGLVNNAGIIHPFAVGELDEERIRPTVEVNLLGSTYVGVHALRAMAAQGAGAVVNTTSSAQMGIPNLSVYAATKGAIATLTYSWAAELAGTGVRVNAFAPSARTRMSDLSPNKVALASPPPADNAPVVTYLLSDASAGITGQVVQRRGDAFVVVAHPQLTAFEAAHDGWDADAMVREFDPVLRAHLQHNGWPPPAA